MYKYEHWRATLNISHTVLGLNKMEKTILGDLGHKLSVGWLEPLCIKSVY